MIITVNDDAEQIEEQDKEEIALEHLIIRKLSVAVYVDALYMYLA